MECKERMISTGFTVFCRYLPVKPVNTVKTLKGSKTANVVPTMMKLYVEALFLIMNKTLEFKIGVMFTPTTVMAG